MAMAENARDAQPVRRQVRFGTAELVPERGRPGRWAVLVDGVLQSYVDLTDPIHQEMPFTAWIAAVIDHWLPRPRPLSVVHVGGGGFTVARYLAAARPGSAQTVFELDDLLTELVREFLELDEVAGLRVEACDGRAGVEAMPEEAIDVLVQDAYRAGDPATALATVEFAGEVARVLRNGGLSVTNMWGAGELRFVLRAVASAAEVFEHVLVFAEAGVFMRTRPGNVVVAASDEPLPREQLVEWASGTEDTVFCLTTRQLAAACGSAEPLTMNDHEATETQAVLRWGRGSRLPSPEQEASPEGEATPDREGLR